MKIVLSGVETNNKGAELMLYAILQEIERKWPEAEVYMSRKQVFCGLDNISTNLKIKFFPCEQIENKLHFSGFYRAMHIPYGLMPHMLMMGKVDYLIDGSGFAFSDQFDLSHETACFYGHRLKAYNKKGTKIILLPQAFGPFEKEGSKEVMSVLCKYATIIMPREKVSLKYIVDAKIADMSKVKMYTDFTSLVSGESTSQYGHLKGGICIIPNRQMINKGAIKFEEYISFLESIIKKGKESGRTVFLLNHEGKKDEELCINLKQNIHDNIEIVTGINALCVKGVISQSYLVISSRFHGVASSLNSCVPCLATSWSHKYAELFKDYGMNDCVLPLNNISGALDKIGEYLEKDKNEEIRKSLSLSVPKIKEQSREMWKVVWEN